MILDVKLPILGFENVLQVEFTEIDGMFCSIKNVSNDGIPAFTLINPFILKKDYTFDIPLSAKAVMDITSDSHLEVYNIVVLQNPIDKSYVNFLAPLVINKDTKTIGQVVLEENKYPFGPAERLDTYLQKKADEESK